MKIPERASVAFTIELLNELTDQRPHLPFPHSSKVEGELRCHHGRDLYRILYRRSEQFIVLLHIFHKDTAQIPESEKAIARLRERRRVRLEKTLPSIISHLRNGK